MLKDTREKNNSELYLAISQTSIIELFKWIANAFKPFLIFVKSVHKKTTYLTESWIRLSIYREISVLLYRGRWENILCFNTISWLQQNMKSLTNGVLKNLLKPVYPSSMWKRIVSKSLIFFQLFIKVYQRFTCSPICINFRDDIESTYSL